MARHMAAPPQVTPRPISIIKMAPPVITGSFLNKRRSQLAAALPDRAPPNSVFPIHARDVASLPGPRFPQSEGSGRMEAYLSVSQALLPACRKTPTTMTRITAHQPKSTRAVMG